MLALFFTNIYSKLLQKNVKGRGFLFWGKLCYFKLILETAHVGKISEKFCCIHFLTNICNNYKFIILLKIAKRKLEFFFSLFLGMKELELTT